MEASEEFTGFADPPMVAGSLTRFSPALSRLRTSRNSRLTIVSASNSSMGRLSRRGGAHQIGQGYGGEGSVKRLLRLPECGPEAAGRGKVIKAVIASAE